MSFSTALGEIVRGCGGGIGVLLIGNDGVPVDQVVAAPVPEGPLSEDFSTAGVEFGRILDEIRKAGDSLAGGAVQETVVVLSRFTLVFRPVDEDLVLVLVLSPDGNLGKARYLMRRSLAAIRQLL